MIALGLVRVIERHSDELAAELIAKLETSSRTADLGKVPVEELRRGIQEILRHLGEWLLTKTGQDIEKHYFEIGERRASQGVALSDLCWAIALTKGHLWEFLQRQGFMRGPVEIYGEMLPRRAMSNTSPCRTALTATTTKRGRQPGNCGFVTNETMVTHRQQTREIIAPVFPSMNDFTLTMV